MRKQPYGSYSWSCIVSFFDYVWEWPGWIVGLYFLKAVRKPMARIMQSRQIYTSFLPCFCSSWQYLSQHHPNHSEILWISHIPDVVTGINTQHRGKKVIKRESNYLSPIKKELTLSEEERSEIFYFLLLFLFIKP